MHQLHCQLLSNGGILNRRILPPSEFETQYLNVDHFD